MLGFITWIWNAGLRWGTALGLPLALISAWLVIYTHPYTSTSALYQTMGVVLGFAGAPLLSWAYISALAKLHASGLRFLSVFRPAGRMSLTGYIGESFLLSLFFVRMAATGLHNWASQRSTVRVCRVAGVGCVRASRTKILVARTLAFMLSKFSKA